MLSRATIALASPAPCGLVTETKPTRRLPAIPDLGNLRGWVTIEASTVLGAMALPNEGKAVVRDVKRLDVNAEMTPGDLARLAREVEASGAPIVLELHGRDVAMITPITRPKKRRLPRGKPLTANDPLLSLIGAGESHIQGGVSGRKHEQLAKILPHKA